MPLPILPNTVSRSSSRTLADARERDEEIEERERNCERGSYNR